MESDNSKVITCGYKEPKESQVLIENLRYKDDSPLVLSISLPTVPVFLVIL
jgi:hypothetical protein